MFQEEVERQREEGERQFQDRLAEGRLQAEGNFTQQVTGFIHKKCTPWCYVFYANNLASEKVALLVQCFFVKPILSTLSYFESVSILIWM